MTQTQIRIPNERAPWQRLLSLAALATSTAAKKNPLRPHEPAKLGTIFKPVPLRHDNRIRGNTILESERSCISDSSTLSLKNAACHDQSEANSRSDPSESPFKQSNRENLPCEQSETKDSGCQITNTSNPREADYEIS